MSNNTPISIPTIHRSRGIKSGSTEANHIENNLPNDVDLNTPETDYTIKTIPPATLHGSKNNLKNIKSFRKLRQTYKVSNQKSIFLTDMKSVLGHLNIDENKMNLELLIEVSNIANEFFIYGKKTLREESKIEAVRELLLPYFLNDSVVLDSMLISMEKKISKSTAVKRYLRRMRNFFFSTTKA